MKSLCKESIIMVPRTSTVREELVSIVGALYCGAAVSGEWCIHVKTLRASSRDQRQRQK